ncbi:hypothetical protein AB205_0207560 [Aquarana catesbeiana]|uniref:Uncharacterized protein n=1 Tax=Aquarana catesbeiana TaxID=8400 RepID=A0A2G9Q3Q6_AQUCT|nr:hypothetical protein AB205_0207560 [Aquarana catesbeiana]
MTFMSPGCGTMTGCIFWQVRLNPGQHSPVFLPRFLPPQLRLLKPNLGLPGSNMWRSPA